MPVRAIRWMLRVSASGHLYGQLCTCAISPVAKLQWEDRGGDVCALQERSMTGPAFIP